MSGSGGTWLKMLGSGIAICIGGPALVQSLRPTDDQLFKRYNPELQKRSLEEGDRRAQDFDNYVNQLKEWSKSDKSIWFAAKEQEETQKPSTGATVNMQRAKANDEARIQREAMRKELLGEK